MRVGQCAQKIKIGRAQFPMQDIDVNGTCIIFQKGMKHDIGVWQIVFADRYCNVHWFGLHEMVPPCVSKSCS